MNGYEIEQVEKHVRAEIRLPLAYEAWADIKRDAGKQRAQESAKVLGSVLGAVAERVAALAFQIRSTAAACTGARLRHDH